MTVSGGSAGLDQIPDASVAIRSQIRGSSFLFGGRLLSVALTLVIQIMIVRALSKSSYGAFAYVLSLMTFGATFAAFALDRAVARFVPIYDEQHDYERVSGTIIFAVAFVTTFGLIEVAGFYVLDALVPGGIGGHGTIDSLLPIMILLAPLQALDLILLGLFALLARVKSIFVRAFVVTPGLRLIAVVVVVADGAGVRALAVGYVVAQAVGLAVFTVFLLRSTRGEEVRGHFRLRRVRAPAGAILALAIPLLTTDLVYVVLTVSDAILLQHFRGSQQVAQLKAVQPAAGLTQLVILSFTPLFTPLAARLFARDAHEDVNDLYWRTAAWIAVLSFPLFATLFGLARPLTILALGSRYADSGVLLAILAVGFYIQSAFGFNGTTLMVYGRVSYIVGVNAVAIVGTLALNVLLIWRYGAVGAAIGTTSGLILHNLLKQLALGVATRVRFFDARFLRVYGVLGLSSAALVVAVTVGRWSVALGIATVLAATAAVLVSSRRMLAAADTFPELLRVPIARRFFT